MKKLVLLSFIVLICSFSGYSQLAIANGAQGYYPDALMFGRTQSIGTARTQAIGGAQVALGGDINSAYANPAGLGFIRHSFFTITPSLNVGESDTRYFDATSPDYNNNMNISNIGIAFSFGKSDAEVSKFKGGSFAITLTRENNFHQDFSYSAVNQATDSNRSTIVETWIDNAWGKHSDNLIGLTQEAFNQYLINDYLEDDIIKYDQFAGAFPHQAETNKISGSQYQWDFAYGGNYDDKLYFGASMSINSVKYAENRSYTESNFKNNSNVAHINRTSTLNIDGTGIGVSAGLIARPMDFLRLAVTASTPTFYELNARAFTTLNTAYNISSITLGSTPTINLNPSYTGDVDYGNIKYRLQTPGKITFGGALFIGKYAFLSADIDFVNYTGARLKSDDFDASGDNATIKNIYQKTINYRAGAEIRWGVFRLRGGYSYQGNPYLTDTIDGSLQQFSGGVGYRVRNHFMDLSVTHSQYKTSRSPYNIYSLDEKKTDLSPVALSSNKNLNIAVTFGCNF